MIAIRLRSKMELGRRLSSTTQKQMKQDRTNTISSLRNENQMNLKSDDTHRRPSSPTIVANPFDPSIENYQSISNNNINIVPITEPGQCFCSTCQTYDGKKKDSLWQLQSPIKKSYSSLQKHLSFVHIKPISMIFSSTKNIKENKNHLNEDLIKNTSDHVNIIKNSLSISNNMKYSIINNSNEHLEKDLSLIINKKPIKRSRSSISSSFSDNYPETVFINSIEKQKKSKSREKKIMYV